MPVVWLGAIRCTPQTPHSVFLLFNQIRSKNVAALYFILFIFLTQVVGRNCFLFYISVHPAFEQYVYISKATTSAYMLFTSTL